MQDTKALVFDLDDTLFPEHEFVLSGFKAVSEWMLRKYSLANFFNVAWKFFQEGKRGKIFNQTLDYLEVRYEPALIQELVQVYREHQPKITLYKDAQWAIDYFQHYKKLGLITNGFLSTQKNKVKALKIESNFSQIIYCDRYGIENWKPSPIPYLKLMEKTGFENAEYIYVGDHPYKDFVAAKNLGWMTLRVCRDDGEYANLKVEETLDAHFKISSLYELRNVC